MKQQTTGQRLSEALMQEAQNHLALAERFQRAAKLLSGEAELGQSPVKRKLGRPPGSKNKNKKKAAAKQIKSRSRAK